MRTASKPGATRNQLLARIHCLQKEAGWSDEEYRDILQARTGQRSSKDLDFAGLSRAVAMLSGEVRRRVPSAQRRPNEWGFIDTAAPEKQRLLRKICALCRAMGKGRTYAEGVAENQSGGVDRRLEMCSYQELYRIAGALSRTQQSRQRQAEKAGGAA